MEKNKKIVYVLGAGFSIDAGAPSQGDIVKAIYDLRNNFSEHDFHEEKTDDSNTINEWVAEFDRFMTNALFVADKQKFDYSLEDIYTPIDRCISDGISFQGYEVKNLVKLRETINKLIILAVRNHIRNKKKDKGYIQHFADHLIDLSRKRLENEKNDYVSVITTNWDIMLDNIANFKMLNEIPVKDSQFCGVVDYCCYMSSLDKDDHKIKPGLYAIGKGGYNLKILKLHGSLNWMQCPKCQRLYVKYYKHFNGGYIFDKKYCHHCAKNFNIEDSSNQLLVNLIMPTFLKNLSNIQNKLIWQNAGIELSEASKVVFLGYSLPQADFEFKQMLSRMIPKTAQITAVLIASDRSCDIKTKKTNYQSAGYRYETFFSGRQLEISYRGVSDYINHL